MYPLFGVYNFLGLVEDSLGQWMTFLMRVDDFSLKVDDFFWIINDFESGRLSL